MKRGDVFNDGRHRITVLRVAKDGAWADISVEQPHGASWTKRQPLTNGVAPDYFGPKVGAS